MQGLVAETGLLSACAYGISAKQLVVPPANPSHSCHTENSSSHTLSSCLMQRGKPYFEPSPCEQEKVASDVDARAAAHKVRRLKRKSADLEPSATITLTATAAAEVAPRCAPGTANPR